MRAYEVAKNGAEIQRGLIMMAIDGPESEVRQVEKILDAQFENTMCEEEGARGEEPRRGHIDRTAIITRGRKGARVCGACAPLTFGVSVHQVVATLRAVAQQAFASLAIAVGIVALRILIVCVCHSTSIQEYGINSKSK